MGKVESIIKSEILRLTKKEIRSMVVPLRKDVRTMRIRLSALSKNFGVLDRMAKEQMKQEASKKFQLEAPLEEVKASRFTPERIRRLRLKLGLSQKDLSMLTGVSMGAVGSWEKGKFEPKMNKKSVLVALRKLHKREIKKLLAERKSGLSKSGSKNRKSMKAKARPRRRKAVRRLRRKG